MLFWQRQLDDEDKILVVNVSTLENSGERKTNLRSKTLSPKKKKGIVPLITMDSFKNALQFLAQSAIEENKEPTVYVQSL